MDQRITTCFNQMCCAFSGKCKHILLKYKSSLAIYQFCLVLELYKPSQTQSIDSGGILEWKVRIQTCESLINASREYFPKWHFTPFPWSLTWQHFFLVPRLKWTALKLNMSQTVIRESQLVDDKSIYWWVNVFYLHDHTACDKIQYLNPFQVSGLEIATRSLNIIQEINV